MRSRGARRGPGGGDASLEDGTLDAPPTFFEVTTAAAFELFRDADVEIAVLEVGLGGRLDATNVVTPVATAITSIDFDHQAQLGTTLDVDRRREGGHHQAWRSRRLRSASGRSLTGDRGDL